MASSGKAAVRLRRASQFQDDEQERHEGDGAASQGSTAEDGASDEEGATLADSKAACLSVGSPQTSTKKNAKVPRRQDLDTPQASKGISGAPSVISIPDNDTSSLAMTEFFRNGGKDMNSAEVVCEDGHREDAAGHRVRCLHSSGVPFRKEVGDRDWPRDTCLHLAEEPLHHGKVGSALCPCQHRQQVDA